MSVVFKDPNVEWNAEALRLSGMLALQGRSASGNRGLLKARLEPSKSLEEHITFQSNFVQVSAYRLQIEADGRRRFWDGCLSKQVSCGECEKNFRHANRVKAATAIEKEYEVVSSVLSNGSGLPGL